jgi:hypothetical protein
LTALSAITSTAGKERQPPEDFHPNLYKAVVNTVAKHPLGLYNGDAYLTAANEVGQAGLSNLQEKWDYYRHWGSSAPTNQRDKTLKDIAIEASREPIENYALKRGLSEFSVATPPTTLETMRLATHVAKNVIGATSAELRRRVTDYPSHLQRNHNAKMETYDVNSPNFDPEAAARHQDFQEHLNIHSD